MGKGRVKELEEYHRWCEVLASWLALIDDNYVNELRQAMVHHKEIKQSEMSAPVASRSARLFYYLQQSLQKFERGMELVRSTSMRQAQAACGYEVMRQMHATFSIVSRMEAIAVRDEALKLPVSARVYKRPLDVVRFQFFLLVLLTVRGTSRAAPEHVDAWFCLGFPGGSSYDGDERADQGSAGDGECSQQSEGVSSSQVGAFRGSRSATGAGGTVSNVGGGWEGAFDERVPWFNATRPLVPAGHPPGERESSDSDAWGDWRAEDARPAVETAPDAVDSSEAAPEATATAPKGAKAKESSKKTVAAATLEEAGGDKSLLRKAPTKLGAATFVSRFHQKKADLLSARFAEKQAERRKKELKAAVLALRGPEVNVKVKELEIALAEAGGVDSEAGDVDSEVGDGEAGGVDSEAGDVDSEVGDGEVVDLEKEGDKSPGSVVPTTPVKKQPGSPQPHTPESVQVSAPSSAPEVPAVETAQVEIKGRPGRPMVQLRPAEVKAGDPQRVAGAPALPRSRSRPCR
eukprot:s8817_g1.t1